MRLSKSRFTRGLQCHRLLWWSVHEPDALELKPNAAQQAVFDQGHRVGGLARERVPGGVLIDLPHDAIEQRVAATRQALADGARVIYEASFFADDTFVAVDILEKTERSWRLIEVKSSTRVKPEYLDDVAVQLHVVRGAGLDVARAHLMHLNRDCVYPNLDNLFERADVLGHVEPRLLTVPVQIRRMLEALRGPLPEVAIGPHCEAPYECPFKSRCWPSLPRNHVSTLYYVGAKKWGLEEQGISTVDQVPDTLLPNLTSARQKRAVVENRLIVEPGLGQALSAIEHPLAVLDVETVMPAVPVWPGCRPYDQVPVQFSCHVEDGHGGWAHHEWLATDGQDPRPRLVRDLAAACHSARTILAYNAPFERQCLRQIAAACPELRESVSSVMERIVDALPLVRDHVYHVDFRGSFSLKSVLPALVPELSHASLAIGEGLEASRVLESLLLHGTPADPAERERLRNALLEYCRMDTWGVVKLLERLSNLARP